MLGEQSNPSWPGPSNLPNKFEWSAFGDSWSSGVTYSADTLYDKTDLEACYRTNQAWGAVMANDSSWTETPHDFHFIARGGSHMEAVTKDQLKNGGNSVTYIGTTGGNNAGIGNIASACIYKPATGAPWGPDYDDDSDKEQKGWCRKYLARAHEYIGTSLAEDFTRVLDQTETFLKDSHKDVPKVNVYFSSYVEFFNDETDESDTWSFGRWFSTGYPKLVKPLRKEMNEMVRKFNAIQEEVVKKKQPDVGTGDLVNFHHIPISDEYAGHRFCEPHHTFQNQWTSADVWIWNLQWNNGDLSTGEESMEGLEKKDDRGVLFMDAPVGVDESESSTVMKILSQDFDAAGGSQSGFGWTARPFHPKPTGHNRMKEVFIKKFSDDTSAFLRRQMKSTR